MKKHWAHFKWSPALVDPAWPDHPGNLAREGDIEAILLLTPSTTQHARPLC